MSTKERNHSRTMDHLKSRLFPLVGVFLFSAGFSSVTAQVVSSPGKTFETAAIHPVKDCTAAFSMSPAGSRHFQATNVSLTFLLGMAYGVGADQLENRPKWATSDCYAIRATAPGEGALKTDDLRIMLQDLLVTRFHLTAHLETKELPGYALVVAPGGPKLTPSKGEQAQNILEPKGLRAKNISPSSLATMLTHVTGKHISDETGLQGRYDIELKFNASSSLSEAETEESLPSLFFALPSQVGLKLEPKKIPVKMLVVDKVDRAPTEN